MTDRTQTEHYLRVVELPEATKSYTVIPHAHIIDKSREMLEAKGFVVSQELYKASYSGQIGGGFMIINRDEDPDMAMTFNWINSYNKQVKFQCSVGGFIFDNDVPFLSSRKQTSWTRKHTGTALDEADNVIEQMIEQAEEHFQNIVAMKNKLKAITINRKEYAKLAGLLFFDKEIILSEQASILRREYVNPSFQYNDKGTLWELYKMIMYAIKENAPQNWYKQQMQINSYIQIMYQVATADEFMLTEEELADIPTARTSINLHDIEPTEETNIHIESDEEYNARVAQIEGEPEEEQQPEIVEKILPTQEEEDEDDMQEMLSCDNCGSFDVSINSSAQVICNNCGHEEDTTQEELEEDSEEETLVLHETEEEELVEYSETEEIHQAMGEHDIQVTQQAIQEMTNNPSPKINQELTDKIYKHIEKVFGYTNKPEIFTEEKESYVITTIIHTQEVLITDK